MPRTPSPSSRPCWLPDRTVLLHVGNGAYVEIRQGDPAPDGVDATTLGPEWGEATPTTSASADRTPEEG